MLRQRALSEKDGNDDRFRDETEPLRSFEHALQQRPDDQCDRDEQGERKHASKLSRPVWRPGAIETSVAPADQPANPDHWMGHPSPQSGRISDPCIQQQSREEDGGDRTRLKHCRSDECTTRRLARGGGRP